MTSPGIPKKYVPGFTYQRGDCKWIVGTVIERHGNWVLIEVTHTGVKSSTWEVVLVLPHNGFSIQGHHVAPSEVLAPTSEWGKQGFTFIAKEDALQKLGEVSIREGHSLRPTRSTGGV
jgi:hypothetical protein